MELDGSRRFKLRRVMHEDHLIKFLSGGTDEEVGVAIEKTVKSKRREHRMKDGKG